MIMLIIALSFPILYWNFLRKYWYWCILGLLMVTLFFILSPNNLLVSTLRHAYSIIIARDASLFTNTVFELHQILNMLGVWFTITAAGGIIILFFDYYKKKTFSLGMLGILWIGLLLTLIMTFFVWIGPHIGFGILPIRMMVYQWLGVAILMLYYIYKIRSPLLTTLLLGLAFIALGATRLPNDAIDSAYILGNEIEVIDYIEKENIYNAVFITQPTNAAVFTFDENDNYVVTNFNGEYDKMFNKIFFSGSPQKAAVGVTQIRDQDELENYHDIYIIFSTIKSTNTYLWPNSFFQEKSLKNANLASLDDGDYFELVFDNNDIKMWKWTQRTE